MPSVTSTSALIVEWFLYDTMFVSLSILVLFIVSHNMWTKKRAAPQKANRVKFNFCIWFTVAVILLIFALTQVNGILSIFMCCVLGFYAVRNIFWDAYYKYYKYPPYVSLGIPFLGNAILFGKDPEKFSASIVCKDGQLPLSSVLLGYQTMIYVNDFKTAKKLLKTEAIGTNRPVTMNQFQVTPDIAFLNGKQWYKRRKFIVNTFGTITNSAFIYKIISRLFRRRLYEHFDEEIISKQNGKWKVSNYTHFIAMYTIMTLIFDNINDDETRCNLRDIDDINSDFYQSLLASLKIFVPSCSSYIAYSTLVNIQLPFIWKIFSAQRLWIKEIDILRQYLIDNKILTNDHKWNTAHTNKSIMVKQLIDCKEYSVDQLMSDCHGLLCAGMETTAKQIELGLVLLAQHPSVQELVANELISVSREQNDGEFHPKLLSQLHAFRAFVHEIIRFGIVSPLGLPHCCLNKDINIGEYVIYKGSSVMINHLAIHHHEPGSDVFDINRWLDREGKFNKGYKIKNFMVFGYASRDCIGQNIAMQEIYSVFALLLSKYVVYNKDIEGVRDIKRTWNLTRDIKPEIPIFIKHRQ